MVLFALTLALVQPQAPSVLHARIVSASVFKPGLAMLVREVEVPAGSGYYALDTLPDAIDGSFFFSSPDGVQVSDVDTTIRLTEENKTYEAKTIPEMILANIGKPLRFAVIKNNEEVWLEGQLTEFDADSGAMTLKGAAGELRSYNASQVVGLDPKGLNTSYVRTGKVPSLNLRFHADAPKVGHVRFTSLETGVAWVASYNVALGPEGFALVGGKAQIGLGGVRFEKTETTLLAGFPTLPSTTKFDMASGFGSLDDYLRGGQGQFRQYRPGDRDPYDLYAQWLREEKQSLSRYLLGRFLQNYGYGFGGGGFGGGGGPEISYNPQSNQFLPNDTSMVRAESLYAYPIGLTTLEPGDRLTKLLFEQRNPYRTLFQYDASNNANTVEQLLRVHNAGRTPWTGGLATITKDGQPLAQLNMPFTPVGRDANLKIGLAPDIVVDKDVSELSAEPVYDPKRPNYVIHRKITEETKFAAENTKDEAVTLEIVLILEGDVKVDGAKIEKIPRRYGDLNPKSRVTWTMLLPAGESKRVSAVNVALR